MKSKEKKLSKYYPYTSSSLIVFIIAPEKNVLLGQVTTDQVLVNLL